MKAATRRIVAILMLFPVFVLLVAGEVRAELLAGGIAVCTSESLSGDLSEALLQWREGDPASVRGQEVALRLVARDAQLFSYWIS